MSKKLRVRLGAAVTATASLIPMGVALATIEPPVLPSINQLPPAATDSTITSANNVLEILVQVLGYVQAFFWILAVFMGLWAAFLYLTARGDAEKISRANHMLIYVVIAVIVAVIAYSIPTFVQTTLTSP